MLLLRCLDEPSAPSLFKHAAAFPLLGIHIVHVLADILRVVHVINLAPRLNATSTNSSLAECCPTRCDMIEQSKKIPIKNLNAIKERTVKTYERNKAVNI